MVSGESVWVQDCVCVFKRGGPGMRFPKCVRKQTIRYAFYAALLGRDLCWLPLLLLLLLLFVVNTAVKLVDGD